MLAVYRNSTNYHTAPIYDTTIKLQAISNFDILTITHSERPKLYAILAVLSAIGLSKIQVQKWKNMELNDTRKIICLRKSKAYVIKTKFLMSIEIGGAWLTLLPCFYRNDIVDLIIATMMSK